MKNKISDDALVLIPAFNESSNIIGITNGLKKYFKNLLVINDGSIDDTEILLKRNNISMINHCVNLGQGAAIETGLEIFIRDTNFNCYYF